LVRTIHIIMYIQCIHGILGSDFTKDAVIYSIWLGLASTIYIRCIDSTVSREITKYTVYIYGSDQPYIWHIYTVMANPM